MTTMADLKVGDQFLFACKLASVDGTGVIHLELYGPSATLAATATIAADGTLTGAMALPPNEAPVTVVTGFVPVTVGDILQGNDGNTYVCRWCQIQPDGSVLWSYSPDAKVKLPTTGFTIVGNVTLT